MIEKKYAFFEVSGENCPCRIYEVLHSEIIGYTCGRDKEVCDKKRYSNCPHGKTLKEISLILCDTLDKEINPVNPIITSTRDKNDPFRIIPIQRMVKALKALLGEE